MEQERISKAIRAIRTKNKLSQQKFAEKYGVTYQAVSKWETGKNIPDISILKQICEDYDIDLNELLRDSHSEKKKSSILKILSIFIVLIVIIWISLIIIKKDNFEFKTLSSSCSNFELSGSIAYNDNKSSIYISHITYCGGNDTTLYKSIECSLYEKNGKVTTEISTCNYKKNKNITLEDFIKDISFHIDNYEKTCRKYSDNSLYLEIAAIENNGEITTYKIPLSLKDECLK